ncbi:hypothetical protein FKG94_07210 [Exilibacterium tricleocarpae]|uniref:Uncharacterized protein n=1 Tax=Exilibacterium tricleocarpae TaxID=2591008 RepID=A0A545TZ95_9GAMM|nr:hypothetical protein [Exilibacterium tricleocarpae]TQV82517.1 hypothetical protein FKG94_07210 [Exilibacterium tricleocarpae]
MSQVFILQNQHQQFLNKHNEWVDGRDASALYKTPHRDEALNQMFEVNAKDYNQRIKILPCVTGERGLPVIDPDQLPAPAGEAATAHSTAGQCAETRQASLEANCERNETPFAEPLFHHE